MVIADRYLEETLSLTVEEDGKCIEESKCYNTSDGCWTGWTMTGHQSSKTSVRRDKCRGRLGRCYVGRVKRRPF